MKVTKFVHSCLLVEDQGTTILIDPGIYSTPSLNLDTISNLDYLLVTHEHADHMDTEFIKKLATKFPQLKVVSNESIKEILGKEGVLVQTTSDEIVELTSVNHEQVFGMAQMCQNVMVTVFGKLSHPGDSFSFAQTADILALPLQAPWGDLTQAAELATKLNPKIIVPIHDWHWKDEVRQQFYERLTQYFAGQNIQFISLENGVPSEV